MSRFDQIAGIIRRRVKLGFACVGNAHPYKGGGTCPACRTYRDTWDIFETLA